MISLQVIQIKIVNRVLKAENCVELRFVPLLQISVLDFVCEEFESNEGSYVLSQRVLSLQDLIDGFFLELNLCNSQIDYVFLRLDFRLGCQDRKFSHGIVSDVCFRVDS